MAGSPIQSTSTCLLGCIRVSNPRTARNMDDGLFISPHHKHKKGMIAIISTILQNLKEILPYVPTCLIGAAVGMVPIGIRLQKNKKLTVCNTIWWYSMLAYIF